MTISIHFNLTSIMIFFGKQFKAMVCNVDKLARKCWMSKAIQPNVASMLLSYDTDILPFWPPSEASPQIITLSINLKEIRLG